MTRYTSLFVTSALVAATIALAPATSFAAGPRDTLIAACAAKAMPTTAVIQVKVTKEKDGKEVEGVGSGSVIDSRGFIITNQHVVDSVTAVRLRLAGDPEDNWRDATIVFADESADLAVLRVKTDKPLPEVEFGTSSDLNIGEPAIVIGSPFGYAFSLSSGVISKLHVPMPGENPPRKYLIQTDAAVNHGNSGGPLFNADCEVIGIIELKIGEAGLGFAITADRATRCVASNMNAEWAGVSHGITDVEASVVGTGRDRFAVTIKSMALGSPAAEVLQLGDRIVKVSGRPIHNVFDLERSMWDNNVGDEVKVDIVRDGKDMQVSMKLVAAPKASNVRD